MGGMPLSAAVEQLPSLVAAAGGTRYPRVRAGEHLLAQTIQSFAYLKREVESGALALPAGALALASFARERDESADDDDTAKQAP